MRWGEKTWPFPVSSRGEFATREQARRVRQPYPGEYVLSFVLFLFCVLLVLELRYFMNPARFFQSVRSSWVTGLSLSSFCLSFGPVSI